MQRHHVKKQEKHGDGGNSPGQKGKCVRKKMVAKRMGPRASVGVKDLTAGGRAIIGK